MALNKKYNPDKSLDAAMGNLFDEPTPVKKEDKPVIKSQETVKKEEKPVSTKEKEIINTEKKPASKKADLHVMIDEDILTEAKIYLLKNKSKKISEYIEGLIKKDLGL